MASDIEKLRALLAEARDVCEYPEFVPCSENRKHARRLRARIDAALAEPVVDCANCEQERRDYDSLAALSRILQRERDEARAVVERLRGLAMHPTGVTWKQHHANFMVAVEDEVVEAYQRGAEAMREAAALAIHDSHTTGLLTPAAVTAAVRVINKLPVPEDKP